MFFWLPDSQFHKMDRAWILVVSWWQTEKYRMDKQNKQTNKKVNKYWERHTTASDVALKSAFGFYFGRWMTQWMINLKNLWRENNTLFRTRHLIFLHQYSLSQNIYSTSVSGYSYWLLRDNVTQVTGNTSQLQIILFHTIVLVWLASYMWQIQLNLKRQYFVIQY